MAKSLKSPKSPPKRKKAASRPTRRRQVATALQTRIRAATTKAQLLPLIRELELEIISHECDGFYPGLCLYEVRELWLAMRRIGHPPKPPIDLSEAACYAHSDRLPPGNDPQRVDALHVLGALDMARGWLTSQNRLFRALRKLSYLDRETIKLLLGIGMEVRNSYSHEEVGRAFKMPASRVRQIEVKALRQLLAILGKD